MGQWKPPSEVTILPHRLGVLYNFLLIQGGGLISATLYISRSDLLTRHVNRRLLAASARTPKYTVWAERRDLCKPELYKGRLISNAHSKMFCQRSKAAMRAQCVLVATTLLHSGAKFHFSTTVLKQCVLTWSRVMVVCQRD